MKSKIQKRSPLRDKPLRFAGQSLDEHIEDKALNLLFWFVFPPLAIVLTIGDWLRYFYPRPTPLPIVVTILTIIATIIGVIKIVRGTREIKSLKMARDGEKIVGEELQRLLTKGATVLNDIQGEKFNIDHVVISPHGIYLVETKTHSKPLKKESKITFDEENIYTDGLRNSRNAINQVKALTNWLQTLLQESTGKKFPIRPVILFPGWFVEKMKKGQDVWILNPKALPVFIENEPVVLKDSEVHLITFHLSRYIRTYKPKK